jgi:hypothetical protein
MRSPCCLCVCMCVPPINFRLPELIFMELGMFVMAPEPISSVMPTLQPLKLHYYLIDFMMHTY